MKLKNKEAEAAWQQIVVDHTHPPDGTDYSRCAVSFTVAWADEMEARLQKGATVADVVKPAAQEVCNRPEMCITGYMFYWALGCLTRLWGYGDQLPDMDERLWEQVWQQQLEAHEPGGLLNPAVLKF